MRPGDYAVSELARLGRELVAGSWSRGAQPMSAPRALVVMAKAFERVIRSGLQSVIGDVFNG